MTLVESRINPGCTLSEDASGEASGGSFAGEVAEVLVALRWWYVLAMEDCRNGHDPYL